MVALLSPNLQAPERSAGPVGMPAQNYPDQIPPAVSSSTHETLRDQLALASSHTPPPQPVTASAADPAPSSVAPAAPSNPSTSTAPEHSILEDLTKAIEAKTITPATEAILRKKYLKGQADRTKPWGTVTAKEIGKVLTIAADLQAKNVPNSADRVEGALVVDGKGANGVIEQYNSGAISREEFLGTVTPRVFGAFYSSLGLIQSSLFSPASTSTDSSVGPEGSPDRSEIDQLFADRTRREFIIHQGAPKVLLIIGHGWTAPGSFDPGAANGNQNEYTVASPVVEEAAKSLLQNRINVVILRRPDDSSDPLGLKARAAYANSGGFQAVVELHYDSAGKSSTGSSAYVGASDPRNVDLAKAIMSKMKVVPPRGGNAASAVMDHARTGVGSLAMVRGTPDVPYALIEGGFITGADFPTITNPQNQIAQGREIALGIANFVRRVSGHFAT